MIGATATLEYRAVVEGNADAVQSGNARRRRVYYRRERGPTAAVTDPAQQARDRVRATSWRALPRASTSKAVRRRLRAPTAPVATHVRLHQRERRQADGRGAASNASEVKIVDGRVQHRINEEVVSLRPSGRLRQ
jgi:hypothetical protein